MSNSMFVGNRFRFTNFSNIPILFFVLAVVASDAGIGTADEPEAELSAQRLYEKAFNAADSGQSKEAVRLTGLAIEKDQQLAAAYYLRGRERFRLGQVKGSAADFDTYVKLRPNRKASLWERGISLYYVGRFREGARQFELYQTTYANDVENSVWRYICVARADGVAKARESILPIQHDRRVPMMEIYRMFRGEATPADVIKAANADPQQPAATLAGQVFYANLYIGLFYDANGKSELARKHIELAADPKNKRAHATGYMWDVARVHSVHLKSREDEKDPSE